MNQTQNTTPATFAELDYDLIATYEARARAMRSEYLTSMVVTAGKSVTQFVHNLFSAPARTRDA